ncbi:FIST C-terminal domain-containing protein [Lutibacter sp.]|uniref:FIST signal transduction protein n=1 Tax=Lutibacter sp. TaxID=1925666 RepID=UPI001A3008E8|nr:FIST C-terminal domain-containing protein [Lutibacter sp.]MBI9042772.1 FIST C-terminal domain-containing protein [Lutibacter sp.]
MTERYVNPNNIDSLTVELLALETNSQVLSILFFMAEDEAYKNTEITALLKTISKPIIGGIFPELIFKGARKKTGVLLVPLAFELTTQLVDLTLSSEAQFSQLETIQYQSTTANSCLFVFTDAFSPGKEPFLETLFNFFGINPTYIGGGAGSLSFKQFPCILNNTGLHKNSAIIGWAKKTISIGVAHGWESISTPLKVTEAKKNNIKSINWKPAFEVYKEIVEQHSGMKFTDDNFFEIAKSYPFGISKMDEEKVVRDPFKTVNNRMCFIDKIEEGAYVEILNGNIQSLLKGAENAVESALLNTTDPNNATTFCIDCISRVLYLNNHLQEELTIISKNNQASGIFSIGEIANSDAILEMYNKTIVMAVW